RDAAQRLSFVVGYRLGRFEDGTRWLRMARAELARAPSDAAEARIAGGNGTLLYAQGKFDEAAVEHRRAATIVEKAFGPRSDRLPAHLGNLANALDGAGRYDGALATQRR